MEKDINKIINKINLNNKETIPWLINSKKYRI